MIKRSLKLKLILSNLAILAFLTLGYFLLSIFAKGSPYIKFTPYIALIAFFLLSILALRQILHTPLRKILVEMKLLLTGKNFRRIYTTRVDEIGILGHFFNEITTSLGKIGNDLKEHKRISEELNLAQKIQHDLIPREAPEIPHLEITAKTKSAAKIGGDSFDFLPRENQSFFYIGDVTGHGIPAGLVMIMVDTLIGTFAEMSENARDLLVNVNRFLKPRLQPNMFMTMVMLRWQHEEKKMHFAGGGHEYILHYKALEKKCESIMSGGIAIGMLPDVSAVIKEQEIDFREGDFIVLYSDGITECKNVSGEQFGLDRLIKSIETKANEATSTKELFDHVAQEVTIFVEDHIQEDDMSLIVVKHVAAEIKQEALQESTDWNGDAKNLPETEKGGIKETGLKQKEQCESQTLTTPSQEDLSQRSQQNPATPQG